MTDDPATSALQFSLRQYREARQKGQARIAELEAELKSLYAQDARLAGLLEQTESALHQALFQTQAPPVPRQAQQPPPYDMEITSPLRQPPAHQNYYQQPYSSPQSQMPYQTQREPQREERYAPPGYSVSSPSPAPYPVAQERTQPYQSEKIEEQVARARREEQSSNIRFNDFRIPQAATIVLREAGHPMHVNEIYQRMADGGFEFRGQHQLITLAVSLSRSKRFRKVAPGTFELSPEFLAGQVA